jgi:hypothetical protein
MSPYTPRRQVALHAIRLESAGLPGAELAS